MQFKVLRAVGRYVFTLQTLVSVPNYFIAFFRRGINHWTRCFLRVPFWQRVENSRK